MALSKPTSLRFNANTLDTLGNPIAMADMTARVFVDGVDTQGVLAIVDQGANQGLVALAPSLPDAVGTYAVTLKLIRTISGAESALSAVTNAQVIELNSAAPQAPTALVVVS